MNDYRNSPEALEVARKYADIIHASRPNSEQFYVKYPRMTMNNRAKIFSPFAALRGYEEKIADKGWKMQRVPKIELSEGEQENLNEKLSQLSKGMTVTIRYFRPDDEYLGTYQTISGIVRTVDSVEQFLRIEDTFISFQMLAEVIVESEQIE